MSESSEMHCCMQSTCVFVSFFLLAKWISVWQDHLLYGTNICLFVCTQQSTAVRRETIFLKTYNKHYLVHVVCSRVVQTLAGRVGSGRVGSRGSQVSLVGSGWVRRCSKCHGSDGSGSDSNISKSHGLGWFMTGEVRVM